MCLLTHRLQLISVSLCRTRQLALRRYSTSSETLGKVAFLPPQRIVGLALDLLPERWKAVSIVGARYTT